MILDQLIEVNAMARNENNPEIETISVKDLRFALAQETRTVMRAADLRVRELADITTAYAAGELTPEQATDRWHQHQDKWGEALPGVIRAVENLSDAEIHADMQKEATPYMSLRETSKRLSRLNRGRGRSE